MTARLVRPGEWALFPENEQPAVSSFAFHEHRERATHLEQPDHLPRLLMAAELVAEAVQIAKRWTNGSPVTVSDLGCGDGGLLSLLTADKSIDAWGYDFAPNNRAGWAERGVKAEALDVFGDDWESVRFGDITVMTEVLEHVADPRGVLRWVGANSPLLVVSSPWCENLANPDECHAWAWSEDGYRRLITEAGYRVLRREKATWSQLVLAWKSAAAE